MGSALWNPFANMASLDGNGTQLIVPGPGEIRPA